MAPVELDTAQLEFDPEFMLTKLIPQYEPFETESLLRAFLDTISIITRLKLVHGQHHEMNRVSHIYQEARRRVLLSRYRAHDND
jgi:hypothetical protein